MINGTITLIRRKYEKDEFGVDKEVLEKKHDIFCTANYPTRAEFFEGARSGLRPSYEFIIHPLDYKSDDEEDYNEVEYEGKVYRIYRVYQTDADHLEVYTEERAGSGK